MKRLALLLGLSCALLAPAALGKTEAASKPAVKAASGTATKKPVPARASKSAKPPAPTKAGAKTVARPANKAAPKAAAKAPVKAPVRNLAPPPAPKPAKPLPVIEKPVPKIIVVPDDKRELVKMPSDARLALRAEMRDRMQALDAVMQLLNTGKVKEAGEVAQARLGVAVWGDHRRLPKAAQPEPYMPAPMQTLALDGYKAASDFATVALTGDRATAIALLPQLTGSCAHCHQTYRIR